MNYKKTLVNLYKDIVLVTRVCHCLPTIQHKNCDPKYSTFLIHPLITFLRLVSKDSGRSLKKYKNS